MNTTTITTKREVKYHGWTLPAGTEVTVEMISLSLLAMMSRTGFATVTAFGDNLPHQIALPLSAVDVTKIVTK